MLKKAATALFLCLVSLASLPTFADQAQPKKANVVRVGETVYVSGHVKYWAEGLFDSNGRFIPDPSAVKTKRIVFVNTDSSRPETRGGGELFKRRAEGRGGVDVVVVGRCDLICAGLYISGKSRTLAPGGYFDLQTPIDRDTNKLETRFPATEFAIFESNPLALAHKDVFYEAFTKGGETGGLRVDATSAQFCESRGPDGDKGCKNYPLNALTLGLITSAEPVEIDIPQNLRR